VKGFVSIASEDLLVIRENLAKSTHAKQNCNYVSFLALLTVAAHCSRVYLRWWMSSLRLLFRPSTSVYFLVIFRP